MEREKSKKTAGNKRFKQTNAIEDRVCSPRHLAHNNSHNYVGSEYITGNRFIEAKAKADR